MDVDGGEQRLVGLEALAAVTALRQRGRAAHPTAGLYEAADQQWWWRTPRRSDDLDQLVWLDADGRPEAAVVATDWDDRAALEVVLLPGADDALLPALLDRGLAHVAAAGYAAVTVEVGDDDEALRRLLTERGFTPDEEGVVEGWLATADRPEVSPLADGYRLTSRADATGTGHHMVGRNGPDVEARLRQTSLYRPDLDLAVSDTHGEVAAYGLFWYDPTTATGLVEPMRTEDAHQRRGLARHVLTAGVARLAEAGAERVKICFEPSNPASSRLYPQVGFVPDRRTDVFVRDRRPDAEG